MGFLKSRNFHLFLQAVGAAALKMLGIHKGFLRFLPCSLALPAKNMGISLFSEMPHVPFKRRKNKEDEI
ncbi:hypothetical protein B5G03_04500 [Gemmiger sp. An50]|nr:hypothetical protein B5G03_04500 [Gemmiger sp. An50]